MSCGGYTPEAIVAEGKSVTQQIKALYTILFLGLIYFFNKYLNEQT